MSRLAWKQADVPEDGHVDFDRWLGRHEYCIAYGYAEIDSAHAREAVFLGGSDDGIKVWVNGVLAHENETQRGYRPGDDRFTAQLKPGRNRILVKIDNCTAGWGFGLGVVPANF